MAKFIVIQEPQKINTPGGTFLGMSAKLALFHHEKTNRVYRRPIEQPGNEFSLKVYEEKELAEKEAKYWNTTAEGKFVVEEHEAKKQSKK